MKKFESTTAQLTLGAVLLAIFVILHIFIPGGQKAAMSMMMILTFLPVTIYAICCGTKKALVMVAAGTVLCALLLPLDILLSYAVPALLIGLAGGLFYGKRKRLAVILIFSVMHLLQNALEFGVYYLLMGFDFLSTYHWAVDLVYQRIPEQWLANELFSKFMADMMICGIPCLVILGAGAKGILSFQIIRLLHSRLVSIIGHEPDVQYTQQTKFTGGGISIAYFCAIWACSIVVLLPVLGLIPYHIICAIAAAIGILLAILYLYYFYINRVRIQEDHQTRLIFSFLLMATSPIGIFALPLLELYLLKKEQNSSNNTTK